MSSAVNEYVAWSLRDDAAKLSCGKISGHVSTTRPGAGLHDVAIEGVSRSLELLTAYRSDVAEVNSWPLALAECYVRGSDLVASYQASDAWPFSPTLYWRANSLRSVHGVIASVSLLVSVQTHLLDTVPQIGVASRLDCDEILRVATNSEAQTVAEPVELSQGIHATDADFCIVRRLADLPLSYVEIMSAGDFHAIGVDSNSDCTAIEWRLFAEFLEKGVIRRARVHAAFVPRANDIEIAAACCEAIYGLKLPLTT